MRSESYPDGVFYFDLNEFGAKRVAQLDNILADTIDSGFEDKQCLLLLDNCEYIIRESIDQFLNKLATYVVESKVTVVFSHLYEIRKVNLLNPA
jgi:hypothetical protein